MGDNERSGDIAREAVLLLAPGSPKALPTSLSPNDVGPKILRIRFTRGSTLLIDVKSGRTLTLPLPSSLNLAWSAR